MERLLAAGVDPNGRDDDRQTSLCAAAAAGRIDLADVLLSHGADLEKTGACGWWRKARI